MKFTIHSFKDSERIPKEFAFCIPADEGHVAMGSNRNPHLEWSDPPEGTKSFAIICVDPDVPSKPDNVNQEGKTVPKDLPRVDFYHWALIDIPLTVNEIKDGTVSNTVTPRGKQFGPTDIGVRGINSYTDWFHGDDEMSGQYGGYDGPCPPWNDELMHHYHFKLFALDIETLGLKGAFTADEALKAMKGHILEEKEWIGTYTLYKELL